MEDEMTLTFLQWRRDDGPFLVSLVDRRHVTRQDHPIRGRQEPGLGRVHGPKYIRLLRTR